MKRRTVAALIVFSVIFSFLALMSAGCSGENAVRFGSKVITVGALDYINATPAECETVTQITLDVDAALSGGELDYEALRALVLAAIQDECTPATALVLAEVVSEVAHLIIENLGPDPLPGEVTVLIMAGTQGVREGVQVYLMTVAPP